MGAIKVQFDGVDITVSNPDDLEATLRAVQTLRGTMTQRAPTPPAPRQMALVPSDDVATTNIRTTLAFLNAIMAAPQTGIEAEDLMKVVGITKPKAMGGVSVRVNNVLLKHQFNPDDVYTNRRPTDGSPRTWKPGARIVEAADALRSALGL